MGTVKSTEDSLSRLSRDLVKDFGFPLPLDVPFWERGSEGAWSIKPYPARIDLRSYLAEMVIEPPGVALDRDGTTWMSTSILERESHAWHLRCSRGRVVVAGLGLGMITHAIASKAEVERLLVCELDPDVIELFRKSTRFASWEHRDKVTIHQGSALSPAFASCCLEEGFGEPDYLYSDIWLEYPDPNAMQETSGLVHSIGARNAGWWGQELDFGLWCERRQRPADRESFETFFDNAGVPVEFDEGYLRFCVAACQSHDIAIETAPSFGR